MAKSPKAPASNFTNVKILCSYGGKILPRRSDGRLRYAGGITRVVSVPASISFSDLMVKLAELCGFSVKLKCQLPNEELDVLVSIKSDEDLSNVIEEYRTASSMSGKELKIRAILSTPKSSSPSPSPSLSSSSSSISSSADLSPRRFDRNSPPAIAVIRRFPVEKAQFNAVKNCHSYACLLQASSSRHAPPSYYSRYACHWH